VFALYSGKRLLSEIMGRCLILSCSKTKRIGDEQLPAVQRYDGPPFRVFRLFLKMAPSALKDVDLYILSASYGLISGDKLVDNYDEKMTAPRAFEMNDQVLKQFETIINKEYTDIFVSLSKDYLRALKGYEKLVQPSRTLHISNESEGKRLSELKQWLYQEEEKQPKIEREVKVTGRAVLRGKVIEVSPDEIFQIAQDALAQENGLSRNIKEWYCLINEEKVSPKWLVSLLSGLKVSEFQASDARRVLAQLGISTEHV
jgi:hypothetical protein